MDTFPMQPFPPGVLWRTTREMLECVVGDLCVPWVQDYVLRSEVKDDVSALTSAGNFRRAISMTYAGTAIPELSGGFRSTLLYARLNIPVKCTGDLGVGIGIYKFDIEDSGNTFISNGYQFARFVSNNRKHSQLSVIRQEAGGKVECLYQYYTGSKVWQYVKLVFGIDLFVASFNSITHDVDFERLNTGLLQSVTGSCGHRHAPRLVANALFPSAIADNNGEHVMKNVFSSYANSQPMISFPVYTDATWAFNYDARDLRTMRNWGITNRLQRLTLGRVAEISTADTSIKRQPKTKKSHSNPFLAESVLFDDFLDCTTSADNILDTDGIVPISKISAASSPTSVIQAVQLQQLLRTDKFVNIAPGPGPKRPRMEEEERERIRLEKREQRKIKKRLAAARSNEKRAARRREGAAT